MSTKDLKHLHTTVLVASALALLLGGTVAAAEMPQDEGLLSGPNGSSGRLFCVVATGVDGPCPLAVSRCNDDSVADLASGPYESAAEAVGAMASQCGADIREEGDTCVYRVSVGGEETCHHIALHCGSSVLNTNLVYIPGRYDGLEDGEAQAAELEASCESTTSGPTTDPSHSDSPSPSEDNMGISDPGGAEVDARVSNGEHEADADSRSDPVVAVLAITLDAVNTPARAHETDQPPQDETQIQSFCVFERCECEPADPPEDFLCIPQDECQADLWTSSECPDYVVEKCDTESKELCWVDGSFSTLREAQDRLNELNDACEGIGPDWDPVPDTPHQWDDPFDRSEPWIAFRTTD